MASERRVRRGSISAELLMCGGGMRSTLSLPLVARCEESIDVCVVRWVGWRERESQHCLPKDRLYST